MPPALSSHEDAERWLALQNQRELTANEAREFEAWLREPQNEVAWRRAKEAALAFATEELRPAKPASFWRSPALTVGAVALVLAAAMMLWLKACASS